MNDDFETVVGVGTSGIECSKCHNINPPGTVRCLKCGDKLDLNATIVTTSAVAADWSVAAPAEQVGALSSLASLKPGTVLGGRYEILKLLGEGGMGAVYKAQDRELERLVAIKVIRPELAGQPEILKRFKQELILARKVTHKNVIRIFDLGQADGIKFITMEYVEGEDLKHILRSKGKLSAEVAVGMIQQVCRALDAAHTEGVVHRDLKPPNIMIDEQGKVLVMDFGIARSMENTGMTQTGALIGTPEYMSPEQARGEKIDQRSDLFTLGVIFYELLTGKSPYKSDTAMGTLLKRIQEQAAPPIEVETTIPKPVSDIVAKCLERDLSQRYQTAAEILQDLEAWGQGAETQVVGHRVRVTPTIKMLPDSEAWKWISLSVAAVLGLLAVGGILIFSQQRASKAPGKQKVVTLLVADFNNATGDSVFDGTLEPMLNIALEGASFVNAYNRGQARRIGAQLQPGAAKLDEPLARLVAVREGIHVIVTGAIVREGEGYSVTERAIDAVNGKQIATQQVKAANKEAVLPAVAKLAAAIRNALGDATPESAQILAAESFTASSLHVAHLYAKGQESQQAGKLADAIPYYTEAVELDPNLGRAHSGLAVSYANLKQHARAGEHYKKALALLDRMSEREKYRTLGAYYVLYAHNYTQAIETFRKLVFLYPADAMGYNNLGNAYAYTGNLGEAAASYRQAMTISPKNLFFRRNFSMMSLFTGNFQTAISEAEQILKENPNYEVAYLPLGLSTVLKGDVKGAREIYNRCANVSARGHSLGTMGGADLDMYLGRYREALELLQAGIAADAKEKNTGEMAVKYVAKAEAHLALGQRAAAVESATRATTLNPVESILFLAARALVQAGEEARARTLTTQLESMLQSQTKSYARLIQGEAALAHKRLPEAVEAFREAQKLHDSWISHFLLGRAYLEAGHFAEALTELETCRKRQGEAADLLFLDMTTLRYLPPLYYWLGRAQEGMGTKDAAHASYQEYLKLRAEANPGDALVADAKRRSGG